jgi:transcriptional regulator with XRE-family HTH domain
MNVNRPISELLDALSDSMSVEELRFSDIASDLAVQITKKRLELGLSQTELAKKLGKTQATVSKWESADCNFQLKTLIEISQKLDLPLTVSFKEQPTYAEGPIYIVGSAPTLSKMRYTASSSPSSWKPAADPVSA